jgi:C4-dicarboxylate transporter DctQ subunit
MAETLSRIDRALSIIEFWLIAGFTLAALLVGTLQVFLRYALNYGFPWSEAIFTLCTIIAMLFAGSRAVRDDQHVRVELLAMVVSPAVRRVLTLAAHGMALALCAYFAYCGFLYVRFAHMIDTASPDTGIPDWITYLLVPVVMGLFAVRYVIRIIRAWRGEDIDIFHVVPAEALTDTPVADQTGAGR